jgi:hypothetical protein
MDMSRKSDCSHQATRDSIENQMNLTQAMSTHLNVQAGKENKKHFVILEWEI